MGIFFTTKPKAINELEIKDANGNSVPLDDDEEDTSQDQTQQNDDNAENNTAEDNTTDNTTNDDEDTTSDDNTNDDPGPDDSSVGDNQDEGDTDTGDDNPAPDVPDTDTGDGPAPDESSADGDDEDSTDYSQGAPDASEGEEAPDDGEPEGDEGSDGGDEGGGSSTNNNGSGDDGDAPNPDTIAADLMGMENKLFSELTPEQVQIKHQELKKKYIEIYDTIDPIINRIGTLAKNGVTLRVYEFLNKKLNELREIVSHYLIKVYPTKTYIENLINYEEYIAILHSIDRVLEQIPNENDEN